MTASFFEKPILNSPYAFPGRHWELDCDGQPTNKIIDWRRRAEFITPIPKPKKRKGAAEQASLVFDEGKGLSTQEQRYEQLRESRRSVNEFTVARLHALLEGVRAPNALPHLGQERERRASVSRLYQRTECYRNTTRQKLEGQTARAGRV